MNIIVARCVGLAVLGGGVAYLFASDSQRKAFWALFRRTSDNVGSARYPPDQGNYEVPKTKIVLSFAVCSSICVGVMGFRDDLHCGFEF
jgi:hypothetical protein